MNDSEIRVHTNTVLIDSSHKNANDNMLMTISEIVVSRNTQSLMLCHETVIFNNDYSNSAIANTTDTNIHTPSDTVLSSITPTKSINDVHKTPNEEEEASSQTHILTSHNTHTFNVTLSNILPSGCVKK